MANLAEDNYEIIETYLQTKRLIKKSLNVEDIVDALTFEFDVQNILKPFAIKTFEARIAKVLEIFQFSLGGPNNDILFAHANIIANDINLQWQHKPSANIWE